MVYNKIALIGLGYLGKIHLKLLFENTDWRLVGVYDIDQNLCKQMAEHYNVKAFTSLYEAIENSDALDIVTPSNTHFDIARQAIIAGKHVFVEKPVTASLKEAIMLQKLVEEKKVCMQVGHVERFNPAWVAAKPYFTSPKFIEVHRIARYNPRGTDVSVVLDLMLHDIDLIVSIIQDEIKSISAIGTKLVSHSPDIANCRIEFKNGCVANLTANRMAMKNLRKFRVFNEDNFVSINLLEQITEVIKIQNATVNSKNLVIDTGNYLPKKEVIFEHPIILPTNAIKEELIAFYNSINSDNQSIISVEDVIKSLSIAEEIDQRIRGKHK